jgi:type I restriction-modification system DNA methylase subunit
MSNGVIVDAKEKARQEIAKLVEKYKALPIASKKKYTEADTKTVFIERLFSALGWDVYGGEEVTQEQKASRGRVDYAFRLRGIPKFFLEAKPLKADLDNSEYAKQVINYAWHKDVTWAVLTDFESLKVFNAEWKEPIVSRSQFFELKCDEYLNRFDWLWLLSRPACEQNLLNERALELFKKTKKTPVGQQLFSDLVSWRGLLAKHLSIYNKKYSAYLIDEAVQRILDRLIFIRTCEDRGIEPPILRPHLREWQNGARKNLIQELRHIWRDFDQGYDSRLFQPHLADELECSPTPFEEVISELYATRDGSIQYNFNDIDADVLGGIYEQYLEHLIKKKGKEVEVISGRGKRKAQGIYYTPKFVVRYIVENTLGPALKDKPLSEARKIRILDPACGSGSFLVETLDYLEKYWQQQKWIPQPKAGEDVHQTDFFDYTTKIQFLSENIHGVDLDTQAVEIAQLNLLLKALSQRERLPNLVNRIREGNSLISGTEDELKRYFGKNWQERKPFNWDQRFADIMAEDGFDIIIGNPPYVRIQTLPRDEADFYRDHYRSAFGSFDVYVLFLEQAIKLLKPGGRLGFITSGKFLKADYGKKIQQILHKECTIESIVDLSAHQIFAEATTYPVITVLRKGAEEKQFNYTLIPANIDLSEKVQPIDVSTLPVIRANPESIIRGIWPPATNKDTILTKLSQNTSPLAELTERIFQGLKTSADRIYSLKLLAKSDDYISAFSTSLQKRIDLEKPMIRPLIKTGQMRRYYIEEPELVILFPYSNGELLSSTELEAKYPKAWHYLNDNMTALKKREGGIFRNEERWYRYGRNQALRVINSPKIITPDFAPSARYSLDATGEYFFNGGTAGGYGIIPAKGVNPLFLLGLLNSKILDWFLQKTSSNFRGGWFSYESRFISHIPIRQIDFSNPTEKKMHNDLVALVNKMLELNRRLAPIRNTPCNEQDEFLREIERTDKKIDELVYNLYKLTQDEREIIEKEAGNISNKRALQLGNL